MGDTLKDVNKNATENVKWVGYFIIEMYKIFDFMWQYPVRKPFNCDLVSICFIYQVLRFDKEIEIKI